VSHADLTAERWCELTIAAAERVAQAIATERDLHLVGLRQHEYAGRKHTIALFDNDGTLFALIPGGRVGIGYDGTRFVPTAGQLADYAESAADYGFPPLAEYVDSMTSQAREVDMKAILVGVDAMDACPTDIEVDDPQVLALVSEQGSRRGGGMMTFTPDGGLEILFDEQGQVSSARIKRQVSYDDAVASLQARGMRLSTPDEWEYACGAGTQTLFRWGDHSLGDGYPYDHRTGPHRELNLWGLAIAQDPYKHEWTSERTIVCGGDGGTATCGGSGFFLGWLSLATSYRDAEFGSWLNTDDGYIDRILVRPIIDLP
jgi:hypothetical protein